MNFCNHECLDTPHGSSIVWRYMGLDKFLDLLVNQRLFFTNASKFTDGHEVSLPQNIVAAQKKKLKAKGFSGRDLDETIAHFEYLNAPMKDLTLVNCWSLGRDESYALWKIYLGGAKAGVAIRTNFSRLKKAISQADNSFSEDFYAGTVQYKNFLPENELNRVRLITTKREFYSYENELRLFILHYPRSEGGIKTPYNLSTGREVKVDLDTLIDQIYLSPFVAHWFQEAVEKTIQTVAPNLVGRIKASSIQDS